MPVVTIGVSIATLELSSKLQDLLWSNYSWDISKEVESALKGLTLVGKPGSRVAHQTICQSRSIPEKAAAHGCVADQIPA